MIRLQSDLYDREFDTWDDIPRFLETCRDPKERRPHWMVFYGATREQALSTKRIIFRADIYWVRDGVLYSDRPKFYLKQTAVILGLICGGADATIKNCESCQYNPCITCERNPIIQDGWIKSENTTS